MFKTNWRYISLIILFIIVGCAKRGSITGGLKDTIAPVLKVSFPENFKTNFKGNEIKLVFDENIKLKNLSKQLIVSPPMKNDPLILPTTASKTITIKIKDTLQPNTTYSFNFGQSIADNNEGNPLNQFKYVFSTGSDIDSLQLSGVIKSAIDKEVESFVSVMLYDVNEKYTDSIVYKETPRYITNTLDSLKSFKFENLKAGKYLLVAVKDANSNNKYNPKTDKIGFIKEFVTVPNDTLYELEIFKEALPFKSFKPTQASGNRLLMGHEGKIKSKKDLPMLALRNNSTALESLVTKFPKKDSLQIWYKPLKADSLQLAVTKGTYKANFSFKIKDQKKDTLRLSPLQTNDLKFRERFGFESNTPLTKVNDSKISIINKSRTTVPFTSYYDEFEQKLFLDFKKEEQENYTISLLPDAVTDFFDQKNDSLSFKITTRSAADYGNLIVQLQNAKSYPVLIELTNEKGEVQAAEYTTEASTINFNLLEPAQYSLRAIYDTNANKEWDSGSFIEKRQAEEVIYLSKIIEIRTNWDVNQTFDLSIPYVPEPKKEIKKKK
ncbi:Ig-like domain-containing protein [Flavobacterium turcicum]|uniref:Ig-like domain-containing protein n=1 Tax=Flavobacterium turcicum TaxID=2764718 RepID=A0ABR7JCF7_9FLAO|nr:Ig-like domain-containing protein [Flavobacterium turcicum]MBC5862187.1 Ig-like domain-containing protein [Flavobacterium turcicum]NHL00918.1 Ig-like domain-containing protein [Flavobacterium turcicum]